LDKRLIHKGQIIALSFMKIQLNQHVANAIDSGCDGFIANSSIAALAVETRTLSTPFDTFQRRAARLRRSKTLKARTGLKASALNLLLRFATRSLLLGEKHEAAISRNID
jgi:hypothetical protein